LIKDILRHPYEGLDEGLGKPEALKMAHTGLFV